MKKTNVSSRQHFSRYALLIAILLAALSSAYATQLTSGVSFSQVSFTAANPPLKYSQYGQVSLDFNMLYGTGYVNIELYENGQPAGWVVKNLPVVSGTVLSGYSTMFDLGAAGYRSTLNAYVDFAPAKLGDDSSLKNQSPLSYQVGQAEYPVLPPAGNNNVFTVRLESACKGADRIVNINALGPVNIIPLRNINYICLVNQTGVQWVGIRFEDPADPPVAMKARQEGRWPFDQAQELVGGRAVDFNGVTRHLGVPAGGRVRATLFVERSGGNITVTPR